MLQRTYAQNCVSGDSLLSFWERGRYKLDSARKWLIYKELKLCFFYGHFSKSLDLHGFGRPQTKL
jgi:hypothetical protein